MIPLSLRAFKGEGEIRTEARMRALHACGPLVQYWGKGDLEGWVLFVEGLGLLVGVGSV